MEIHSFKPLGEHRLLHLAERGTEAATPRRLWKVYFFRVEEGRLGETLEEVFNKLDWKNQLRRSDTVLIKPNFLSEPKPGVTTSLEVVRAVVEQVKDKTSNVYVGETDSTAKDFDRFAGRLNLDKVLNLSREPTVLVSGRYGQYRLPELALKAKLINLPAWKTHLLTKVSLGVKNLFGLVQDKLKMAYHWKLDKVLYDLYHIFRPTMNILDGLYVLDIMGPTRGRIRRANVLVASSNTLALDSAVCNFMGVKPGEVSHLRKLLEKEKVEYEVLGDVEAGLGFIVPKVGFMVKFFDFTRSLLLMAERKLKRG